MKLILIIEALRAFVQLVIKLIELVQLLKTLF